MRNGLNFDPPEGASACIWLTHTLVNLSYATASVKSTALQEALAPQYSNPGEHR